MKITISELRQIIIEEVEREAKLEETYASEVYRDELDAIQSTWADWRRRRIDPEEIIDKKIKAKLIKKGLSPAAAKSELSNWKKNLQLEESLNEELTKTDKAEIKRMISKELDSSLQKELKKALEEELTKALKSKDVKTDIGEISKKVLKKLYKDLSFHHPYIIDRIKV